MAVPIIRNSERRTLKRCSWKWYWSWRMGLKPVGNISDALWFGGLVHEALAVWYCGPGLKRGPHPAESFEKLAGDDIRLLKTENKTEPNMIETKYVPALELGCVLLDEYVKHWGRDDSWHVIQPERAFQMDIPNPDQEAEGPLAILAGTYDLVYRDLQDDKVWLGEHKTAKAISLDHLQIDDQAGTYWAVAAQDLRAERLIGPKEPLQGINYNFLRKALPDDRPRNAAGYVCNKPVKEDYLAALVADGLGAVADRRWTLAQLVEATSARGIEVFGETSKLQPKPLFVRHEVHRSARERATQVQRIQDEAVWMSALRRKELPLVKNPTRDCNWDCDLFHFCMLDEAQAIDATEYRKTMFRKQDPYADHRKSTDE